MGNTLHILGRVAKWTLFSVIALLLLLAAAVGIGTWMLTPERLTRLVNEEASRELNADVRAHNVRFTLWSTFPHLCLDMDSLTVRSRNFDSISPTLRAGLPAGADMLLRTGSVSGGINLLKLLSRQIWVRDVDVDSLRLNFVVVNDTLNNYRLVTSSRRDKVPYFHIDGMKINGDGNVRYTALQSNTTATVNLADASLMPRNRTDNYRLALRGKVSATSDRLAVLENFPFELDGNVNVRFRPFRIRTDDYNVSLGQINGVMSIDVNMGQNASLNNFNYQISDFSLSDLLAFLPPGNYPVLDRLQANGTLNATARLTSPYNFASSFLPDLEVDFTVPDAAVSYLLSDREKYSVHNVALIARLFFNGHDPARSYVDVPEFSMSGFGTDVTMRARVSDLTDTPQIEASLTGRSDLTKASQSITALKPYGLKGRVNVSADVAFRLDGSTLRGTSMRLRASSDRLAFNNGTYRVEVDDLRLAGNEKYPRPVSLSNVSDLMPVNLTADARNAHIYDRHDSVEMHIAAIHLDGKISHQSKTSRLSTFRSSVQGDNISINTNTYPIRLNGVNGEILASRRNSPRMVADFKAPASWRADARTIDAVEHTPEFLSARTGEGLRSLMSMWDGSVRLRIRSGRASMPGFPTAAALTDLDMSASFDSVTVHGVNLQAGETRGHVSGTVSNLRQFLGSASPAPLALSLNLDLDTVQINQLARIYAAGHPDASMLRKNGGMFTTLPDSMSLIVPRNLVARIHAHADQTRYINLHLYDLYTDIAVADGIVNVDTLHIGADFGHAHLRAVYDTHDLQQMQLNLGLGVDDIDVVGFFDNFHKLLLMMPEMKNLSGTISADATAGVRIFPDMNIMAPSLRADAIVEGLGLKVHQNKFIRHLTRMLLIPDSGDLHIANMKIHAGVHSNLLEVFPFTFEVSDYRLFAQGINNFDGNLYYHIGVEKWPLKIPFGLNIKGRYHHPVVRFGGKDWKDEHGAEITAGVEDYMQINVIKEIKKYAAEFVRTAAEYKGD